MKRSICSFLSVGLLMLSGCPDEPSTPPTTIDLRGVELDLRAPVQDDLRPADDLRPPADLLEPEPCLHGQTRKNGVCSCTYDDDIICGAGHCCQATQACLPGLGSAMYRCSGPEKRQRAAMAYDAARKVTLVYSGMQIVTQALGTHFELTQNTWSPLRGTAMTGAPSPRHGASVVYDEVNKRLLLFGGQSNATTFFNETWEYNGSTWNKITVPTSPSARALSGIAYDSARRVVVLYGGDAANMLQGDTWEFNVMTNRWVLRAMSGSGPQNLEGMGLAYDAKNRRTVLYGGAFGLYRYSADTWFWDGTSWTKPTLTGTAPEPRAYFGMAYDANRNVTVMTGGETNAGLYQALSDIFELADTTWTRKLVVPRTEGRLGHSMTYDATRKVILYFGGLQNNLADNSTELWSWDGTTRTRLY